MSITHCMLSTGLEWRLEGGGRMAYRVVCVFLGLEWRLEGGGRMAYRVVCVFLCLQYRCYQAIVVPDLSDSTNDRRLLLNDFEIKKEMEVIQSDTLVISLNT